MFQDEKFGDFQAAQLGNRPTKFIILEHFMTVDISNNETWLPDMLITIFPGARSG